MTILKWVGGVVLALMLLIIIAIVVIPQVVDPNDYREKIISVVKTQTGRDLKLDGDLTISVFPWLGVRTQQLSFSQPSDIGGDMVVVETAQLRLKLLPLLSSRVEIDTVVLESPKLRIITLADGTSSFSGLSEGGEEAPGEVVAPSIDKPAAPTDNTGTAVALVIQGLELTDGELLWDDQQAGQKYEISALNLVTGNLLGSSLADIDASGSVLDSSNPDIIEFSLNAKARIDSDTLQVFAKDLLASLKQGETNLKLGLAEVLVDQRDSAKITGLTVDAQLSPAMKIEVALGELDFSFKSNSVKLSDVIANASVEKRAFKLSIPKVQANLDSQIAAMNSLTVDSDDLSVALTGLQVSKFMDAPQAQGTLKVKPFNVAKLLSDMAIDYVPSDKTALKNVGFDTQFSGGVDGAGLDNIQLTLDQSQLTGSFSIANFDSPEVKFELDLNQLNLDRYLPVEAGSAPTVVAKSSTVDAGQGAASGTDALAVPMAILKQVNANGYFKAQQLISGGLELNNVDVQVVSSPGKLTITPKASLYDGSLGGDISFIDSQGLSTLRLQNKIASVDLGKLLAAADVTDQLSGIGTLGLDIKVTEKNGLQANQGVIALLAKDGAIKGVDIQAIIKKAASMFSVGGGDKADAEGSGEENAETRFAELSGTFILNNNKVTNNDFTMKAPLFRVGGEGEIDLAAESLNYLVKVTVVNSADGQGGEAMDQLSGVTIPIRLSGSFAAPSYSIDTKVLFKLLARKKLEDKLGVSASGSGSSKDLLKGFLNQDSGEQESSDSKTTKQQGKDDLKKKLLEGLFK
ncbi:MAG: AsmA protein [Dinoroseobacter sp.]|jgi:AsmA protein